MFSIQLKANIRNVILFLMFACNLVLTKENIKIQLDETFDFIGSQSYNKDFTLDGLETELLNHLQNLLIKYYGSDIIEVRLKDMSEKYDGKVSNQKYIYVKGR